MDPDAYRQFSLKEKDYAAYVMANFEGQGWSGNLGARFVRTDENVLVNVAIPDMSHHFTLGQARAQWVTSGFMVATTVAMATPMTDTSAIIRNARPPARRNAS